MFFLTFDLQVPPPVEGNDRKPVVKQNVAAHQITGAVHQKPHASVQRFTVWAQIVVSTS